MLINFQYFILTSSGQPETPVIDLPVKEDQEGPSELDVAAAAAKADTEAAVAALEATLALPESAKNDLASAKVQIDKLQNQLQISRFGLERFLADDNSVKFYTGFPSYSHLYKVLEILQPSAEQMTSQVGMNSQQSRPSARIMILIDDFFLFLVRVRVGLQDQELAGRFQIHLSTVSRRVITFFWKPDDLAKQRASRRPHATGFLNGCMQGQG